MKARVKATGEIVEVHTHDDADFQDRQGRFYWEHQLYFGTLDDFDKDDPDYWTRLEHQAAIGAMQGLCANYTEFTKDNDGTLSNTEMIAENARLIAHALVDKLKVKEERQ